LSKKLQVEGDDIFPTSRNDGCSQKLLEATQPKVAWGIQNPGAEANPSLLRAFNKQKKKRPEGLYEFPNPHS
jgi:hypothetical protein